MRILQFLQIEISQLGMTPAHRARWKDTRAAGRRHFVWKEGVLKCGLLFLLPLNIVGQYFIYRASLTGFEHHPEFEWLVHGMLSLVIGFGVGYLICAWSWRGA